MIIRIKKNKVKLPRSQSGFTLMEILVATTLFAFVSVATSELFVSTLRINRRSDALRQSAESIRGFVEFLAKDIRNGQIDYGFIDPDGSQPSVNSLTPCSAPAVGTPTYGLGSSSGADNKLGVINPDGTEECIYLAYGPNNTANAAVGTYVGGNIYATTTSNPNPILAVVKTVLGGNGAATLPQPLNPVNSRVDAVSFFVRPATDPYYVNAGTPVEVQPFVFISLKFTTTLATGEQVPVYYQTSVSTDKYDLPHS